MEPFFFKSGFFLVLKGVFFAELVFFLRLIMTDTPLLGKMIELEVLNITEQGAFVDAKDYGELFIPKSQLPLTLKISDLLRVFLYNDGTRILATARHPYLELGMLGRLRVNAIENGTCYLDLGIPKELVLPVSEQRQNICLGQEIIVYVAKDDYDRLYATQKYMHYFSDLVEPHTYKKGEEVTVVAIGHTPLGYRVVVNDRHYGLLYKDEVRTPIKFGKRLKGYISKVRDDNKLDVTLSEMGASGIEHAASELLAMLNTAGGFLPFNDKSAPDEIEDYLHMSKGKFKKAIGNLYKRRLIEISHDGIRLLKK